MNLRTGFSSNMLFSGVQKINFGSSNQTCKTNALSSDVFEKEKQDSRVELCPDNMSSIICRNIIRKHIYDKIGIVDDTASKSKRTKSKSTTSRATSKMKSEQDELISKLHELDVSEPVRRLPNMISGGKIDTLPKSHEIADALINSGVTHIVYFKDMEKDCYEDFAKSKGFEFLKIPHVVLDLSLYEDQDFTDLDSDEDFIAEDFKKFMLDFASLVKEEEGKVYVGCELGTIRTDIMMYYLSALVDGIDTSDIQVTDAMKNNFEYLRQYKDTI